MVVAVIVMRSLDTRLVCKQDTFCMMKPWREEKKKLWEQMKISWPSASIAARVSSSISSSHPQKIIMFSERERFGNIFFLTLSHSVSSAHTVTLWSSYKWNEILLPASLFLTALSNYASLKQTLLEERGCLFAQCTPFTACAPFLLFSSLVSHSLVFNVMAGIRQEYR